MTSVTQAVGCAGMHLAGLITLSCLFSGCPNDSSPAEEKIPSRWIRIEPDDESPADAVLTAADVERLKATVPTIMKLVAERQAAVAVSCDGRTRKIGLCATSPDMLELLVDVAGATVSNGRFLTPEDNQEDQSVIVLTEEVAESLFAGASPVGQEVTIGGEEFVVVGTLLSEDRLAIRQAGHEAYVPMASPAMAATDAVPAAESSGISIKRRICFWHMQRVVDIRDWLTILIGMRRSSPAQSARTTSSCRAVLTPNNSLNRRGG